MCGPGDKVLMVHSGSSPRTEVGDGDPRKERVYDHDNVGKRKELRVFDGDLDRERERGGGDDATGLGAAPQVIGVPSKPAQASFRASPPPCLAFSPYPSFTKGLVSNTHVLSS